MLLGSKTIAAAFFGISINFALAQEKVLWDMSLEELLDVKVVTATKRETEALKVAAIITILTREQLAIGGAENLADGLRFASGINVRISPGSIPQYNISIRGNGSDFMNMRTLFLIDGVPVRNINAGFDPGWIPLSIIKRVEIVKGPTSNLWGANAFGGVINVITMRGEDLKGQNGEASVGYQSRYDHIEEKHHDGHSVSATLGKSEKKWDYLASAQYIRAKDSKLNYTGHRYQDVFGRISSQLNEKVNLSMQGLLSLDQNQIAMDNAHESIKNTFGHLAASAEIKLDADSTLRFTPFLNTFDHNLNYSDALKKYENRAVSLGLNSQYTTMINDLHSVVAGLDFVAENGLLDTNSFDYSNFPPTVDEVGWDRKYQSTWGTYLQYEYLAWEKLIPTAGIRYDQNSLFGNAISPRLSLSYSLTRNLNLYTSVGRGFRAPVFNETHIDGYGKVGKRDLNPEIITTYEIGLKNVNAKTQNSLALFLQEINDKIVLEFIDASDPNSLQTYKNVGESNIFGLEFEGSYHFIPSLRAFYNSTLLKSEGSKKMERLIETKFVFGLDYTHESWSSRIVGIQESEQFYFNTNSSIPDDGQNRVFIPKQTTANIELSKKIGALASLRAYVNNFTNLKYKQTFSSFEIQNGSVQPGRRMGLEFRTQF